MTGHILPQRFASFLESAASATYDEFRSLPGSQVESQAAFEEMRKYLVDLYKGSDVVASFVEDNGQVIDCFPAAQHPAMKRWGDKAVLSTPPAALPQPTSYGNTPPSFVPASSDAVASPSFRPRDQDGVDIGSKFPSGTLPMYRTTLQQLCRFRTLSAFCAKERPGKGISPASGFFEKRYATGEQDIACLGGASYINIWKPWFVTPSFQETYSQQWHEAGQDGSVLQTVECGWHVDAARYGDSEPHLFLYTTRDTYQDGDTFWNLDGGIYVPLPNSILPGAKLSPSSQNGTQVEAQMGFYLTNGGWYFYFQGIPSGFYPLSWFNNGPMASGATRIKFGGEVGRKVVSSFPPMGSGQPAAAGFGKSAFQRVALVYPATGGAVDANLAVAGSTTGPCYTIDITNNSGSNWGTYLFYGGAGGDSC